MIGMLRCYAHQRVTAPPPAPVQCPTGPLCGARDWLSGAVCGLFAGHDGRDHVSEDQDFEIRWTRSA